VDRTRAVRIVPSRCCQALIIMLSVLSLFSCSLSFDNPWEKKPAELPQQKPTPPEVHSVQKEGKQLPSSASSDASSNVSSGENEDGRKWKRYMTDDQDVRHFIDEEAITRISKDVIQMWRKREFPPGATQRRIVTLDELNCPRQEFRTVELQVTYSDGRIGRSKEPGRWAKIYENTNEEYLMDEYCK